VPPQKSEQKARPRSAFAQLRRCSDDTLLRLPAYAARGARTTFILGDPQNAWSTSKPLIFKILDSYFYNLAGDPRRITWRELSFYSELMEGKQEGKSGLSPRKFKLFARKGLVAVIEKQQGAL